MNKLTIYCCYLLLLGVCLRANAQQEDDNEYFLVLQAQAYQDSVVLRWVPNGLLAWNAMNKYGIIVERSEIGVSDYLPLNSEPIFPYTLSEWKSRTDTTNIHVATAAQCLLGEAKIDVSQGGSLSQKLLASQEQMNKLALAAFSAEFSIEAANGLALRYVDRQVDPKTIYNYRIKLADQPKNYIIQAAETKVNSSATWIPRNVIGLKVENGDGEVKLSWPKAGNNGTFSGYYIEKGDKKGKNFKRLNEIIYKSVDAEIGNPNNEFYDQIEKHGEEVSYRVIGITSFADMGLYSDVVLGKSIDLRPPAPPDLVIVKALSDSSFNISWEENKEAPDDHIGYHIARGIHIKGPFTKITDKPLDVSSRNFVDENPVIHRANYYIVITEDKSGNTAQSFASMGVLPDGNPPAKPKGLFGSIDTLGVVSLAWEFGTEPDLMGYRVYRSNGKKRDYIQITKTPEPGNFYRDTVNLKTLTEKVYYMIAAFDFNYNPSEYSDTLELEKPDFVPPSSPQFKDYQIYSDSVKMEWAPSSSKDVVSQFVYRKERQGNWIPLAALDTTIRTYTDTTVVRGNVYTYAMGAIDDANLISEKSFAIAAHIQDDSRRAEQPKLSGYFDKSSKSFKLNWDFTANGNYRINIYRNTNNEGMKYYASINSKAREFEDKAFFQNENGYEYAIKAIFDDGGESPFSNKVVVNLK